MSDIHVFIEHFQGKVADISYVCLAQAKQIASKSGSKVVAVLMGEKVEALSKDLLADEVLMVEQEVLKELNYTAYVKALTQIIQEKKPALILMGDTSIGSDIAGGLSLRTGLPLVSFCKEIISDGGLTYVAQICSGKIYVQGKLPGDGAIVTMLPGKFKPEDGQSSTPRPSTKYPVQALESGGIVMKEVVLPSGDDLDITKEKILVAVGRGIENEDNVDLAQELADALGGVSAPAVRWSTRDGCRPPAWSENPARRSNPNYILPLGSVVPPSMLKPLVRQRHDHCCQYRSRSAYLQCRKIRYH